MNRSSYQSGDDMASRLTRRAFLAQGGTIGTVGLLGGVTVLGAQAAASDTPLLTNVPLDRLAPDIEAAIERAMIAHKVPGLSIALVRDGRTVWSKGFGVKSKETAKSIDDETVYEAASLIKPVIAYSVLSLSEQGRLDLDEPLAKFLPQPYVDDKSGFLKQVTARHVLTHTTGLPNWLGAGKPARFFSKPGFRFGYSGEGFVYLQRVVERITELPLDAFMRKQLFEPLGMSSASLVWRDDYQTRMAHGYGPTAERGILRKQPEPNAASSLVCTAADYARFVERLLAKGTPAANGLVVADVRQMWEPRVKAADGVSWGLGIGVEHTPDGDAFWQWGNNGDVYHSFVVGFPNERIAVVVMTNSGNGLKACAEIIPAAIGGEHPALRWSKVVS